MHEKAGGSKLTYSEERREERGEREREERERPLLVKPGLARLAGNFVSLSLNMLRAHNTMRDNYLGDQKNKV